MLQTTHKLFLTFIFFRLFICCAAISFCEKIIHWLLIRLGVCGKFIVYYLSVNNDILPWEIDTISFSFRKPRLNWLMNCKLQRSNRKSVTKKSKSRYVHDIKLLTREKKSFLIPTPKLETCFRSYTKCNATQLTLTMLSLSVAKQNTAKTLTNLAIFI